MKRPDTPHTEIQTVLTWLKAREDYYGHECTKYLCTILAGRSLDCGRAAMLLRGQLEHAQNQEAAKAG